MKLAQKIAFFALVGTVFAGCTTQARYGTSQMSASYERLFADLTPELQGSHERPIDVTRNVAIVNNLNLRLLSDDLGKVFYTSHPSRLTPFPAMSFTGNPF